MDRAELSTEVCVAGGGPAGVVLGLLLARAGVEVVVLEKHADFFRDFRGDTVHPSTLDLIDQLGVRDEFERIPHTRVTTLDVVVNGVRLRPLDLRSLRGPNREIALMPQWDLLDLLANEGRRHPGFRLVMGAEVTDVRREAGRVTGVVARTGSGELMVTAPVTVAADGRGSTVRRRLGLPVREYGVPIDVLWLRLPRPATPLPDTLGYLTGGSMVITIPRPDYLQCGMLIPKGSFDEVRARGLPAFRDGIARAAPPLREVVDALTDWDDVKLLSVQVNRLPRWSVGGALCIGDAAHAMSPAFGVGINYAVQDAVATANILVPVLRRRPGTTAAVDAPAVDAAAVDAAFQRVQRRRARPTALMQGLQVRVHRVIADGGGMRLFHSPPTRVERATAAAVVRVVRPLGARLVGYGFRPERIKPHVLRGSGNDGPARLTGP
ncbi:MAG TPA: FAD-dependent oxidoreductase [Micromonosporaceae bacterium]|nr:FAD-dependent oxidoreductase [Micromonosporaceae bacterium]